MKARKYEMGGPIGPKAKARAKGASEEYKAKRSETQELSARKADAYKRQLTLNRAAAASKAGDPDRAQRIASSFQGMSQNGISSAEVSVGVRTPEAASKSVEKKSKEKK